MNKITKIFSIALISGVLLIPLNAQALEKKETVYTNLDYTGKPYKTVVNNHLYLKEKGNIEDETELKDILNINGKEKYDLKNNKLIWKSKGKDIFYQGTTEKELPITIKATYYLNGQEMQVEDMLGKKGKVKIELNLENNVYMLKNSQKLYTPFVTTIATMISNKQNSNISINNGKVVDTGSKNIVVGISAPGLYESTKINELKDLDQVTISYDTTKFSLNEIYIVATPKLLEDSDFDIFNKVNLLSSSINLIKENMDKIETGAKELETGSKELNNGAKEIADNLKNVSTALNNLENGSSTLDSSLKQITTLVNQAQQEISKKDLTGSINQLNYLYFQNENTIGTLNSAALAAGINLLDYESEAEFSNLIQNLTVAGTDANTLNALTNNYKLIQLLKGNNMAIKQMLATLSDLQNMIGLVNQLNTALNQVENGADKINNGINQVRVGVDKLYNGSLTLVEGMNTLSTGINSLSTGISTLNKEGISKLVNYSNKLKTYSSKAQDIINLSKDYKGYAANNVDNTIFIYKMKASK